MSYVSNLVRSTAFHEAGHAVVARNFGLKVVALEIRKDGSSKIDTVGCFDDLPLIDQIVIYYAGHASRTVFKCRSHMIAISDRHIEISKLLEGLTDELSLELRNAGYRRAIQIVKSKATEVERLASLLIKLRRVDRDEMERMGGRSSSLLPEIVYGEDVQCRATNSII